MASDPAAVSGTEVAIWRLESAHGASLPEYMTTGAAGCDLAAALPAALEIPAGGRARIPTGLGMALPAGLEAQIRPRSGLAARCGVTVLNAPGTIDSDYRGEIQVLLVNLGQETARIEPGDRVAQLVVAPVIRVRWKEVSEREARELLDTDRGSGGFGHTGTGGDGNEA